MPENNKLIILSAPSGAGKTTIARHLLEGGLGLEFSVSACSRSIRPGEVDGKDYYFLSLEEFRRKIGNDEFIEWEEVYTGHFYGTLKSEIKRIHKDGHSVLFDVDVKGGINLKRRFGSSALSIFIMPPSLESLKERLINRHTDSPEEIKIRLAKAEAEMKEARYFDHIVINDDLQTAIDETKRLVRYFIHGGK